MLRLGLVLTPPTGAHSPYIVEAPLFATQPAYVLAGRLEEALRCLEEEIAQGVLQLPGTGQIKFRIPLGDAYLLAGRLQEAQNLAAEVLTLVRQRQARGYEAHVLRCLGDIAMHSNPLEIDQAKTHYQQALALATELGMRPLQAHCHRGLGMLYRHTGQSEPARTALSTAIAMYREMAMTFWLLQVEAGLAEVEN